MEINFSIYQNIFFSHNNGKFTQDIIMNSKLVKNRVVSPNKTNSKINKLKFKELELKPFLKKIGLIRVCKKTKPVSSLIVVIKTKNKKHKSNLKVKSIFRKTRKSQVIVINLYKSENIKKPITKNCFKLKKQKNKILSYCYLLLIGLFIGFVNGFWGGGGGMICVPTLTMLLGVNDKRAHATTILIMLPLSIASFVVYLLNGTIQWNFAGVISGGFVLGGVAGALILKKINNTVLRIVFSLVIIAGAIKMLI